MDSWGHFTKIKSYRVKKSSDAVTTRTGSCITVASVAVHLFGLGDGHSFTTRRHRHTHTQTRTHVSEHTGSCGGLGRGHRLGHGPSGDGPGEGWGPHASSGVGVIGRVLSLVTKRSVSLGEGMA